MRGGGTHPKNPGGLASRIYILPPLTLAVCMVVAERDRMQSEEAIQKS